MNFSNKIIKDIYSEQLFDMFCDKSSKEHTFSANYRDKRDKIIDNAGKNDNSSLD